MKIKKPQDELELDSKDVAVKYGSGVLGSVPLLGPMLVNMFEMSIPGLRMDRIADTLRRCVSRIEDLEQFKEKMGSPEGMDFIEDLIDQSRTALSEERREYLGNLFRNSITKEDLDHIQKKDLFRILSELNDIEILHLKHQSLMLGLGSSKHQFWVKHQDVLRPVTRSSGATPEDMRKAAFEDLYINHLERLGLLIVTVTGGTKKVATTGLGHMLLDYIEVSED